MIRIKLICYSFGLFHILNNYNYISLFVSFTAAIFHFNLMLAHKKWSSLVVNC